MSEPVVEIKDLHVHYRALSGRRIHAVRGLSLEVHPGEVVGFIGPNGAGKSTTIKTLLGFQRATSGSAKLYGLPAGAVRARQRLGFLPEVALYYPFLTARETLRLYAKLAGVPKDTREDVITGLLQKVNLTGRDSEPLRGFSKGMLQRVGIAQAIMGDPDLLILDEVTSGLDPVARHDVRNILLNFKARGKTVFFSSHELSEVTMLCDRVILIDEGKLLHESELGNLLEGFRHTVVEATAGKTPETLPQGVTLRSAYHGKQTYTADSSAAVDALLAQLHETGITVLATREEQGSLEDYFVRSIGHKVS